MQIEEGKREKLPGDKQTEGRESTEGAGEKTLTGREDKEETCSFCHLPLLTPDYALHWPRVTLCTPCGKT